jgi:hypothetical protein
VEESVEIVGFIDCSVTDETTAAIVVEFKPTDGHNGAVSTLSTLGRLEGGGI